MAYRSDPNCSKGINRQFVWGNISLLKMEEPNEKWKKHEKTIDLPHQSWHDHPPTFQRSAEGREHLQIDQARQGKFYEPIAGTLDVVLLDFVVCCLIWSSFLDLEVQSSRRNPYNIFVGCTNIRQPTRPGSEFRGQAEKTCISLLINVDYIMCTEDFKSRAPSFALKVSMMISPRANLAWPLISAAKEW